VRSIAHSFSPTASSQRAWLNRWKISDPRKCAYSSRDTSEFTDFSAIVDGREIPIQPDGNILGKFTVVVGGLDSRFGLWSGEISVRGGAGVFLPIGKIQSMQGRGSRIFSGSRNRNTPVVFPAILRSFLILMEIIESMIRQLE
jgi:hypothetical protein